MHHLSHSRVSWLGHIGGGHPWHSEREHVHSWHQKAHGGGGEGGGGEISIGGGAGGAGIAGEGGGDGGPSGGGGAVGICASTFGVTTTGVTDSIGTPRTPEGGADPIDSWRAEATIVCTLRMTLGRVTAAAGLVVMPGMMARAVTRIDATARSMIK